MTRGVARGVTVLLDTHVVLWALAAPERLRSRRELVADPATRRLLSAVVTWEVAIKSGLGRLDLPTSPRAWAARAVEDLRLEPVPITPADTLAVADLPLHHRDPFDRLLVAQARERSIPLLTADPALRAYDVDVLLVE